MDSLSFPEPLSPKELGRRLRLLREEAGLDQVALADALGVSQNSISRWERGEQTVSIAAVCRLAWALGRPLDYVLRPPGAERVYLIDSEHVATLRSGRATARDLQRPLWREIDSASKVLRDRSDAMALEEELSDDYS